MGTSRGAMTLNSVIRTYSEDGIVITEEQAQSILEFLKKLTTIFIKDLDDVRPMLRITKDSKSTNSL